jgi:hypothetical protein
MDILISEKSPLITTLKYCLSYPGKGLLPLEQKDLSVESVDALPFHGACQVPNK